MTEQESMSDLSHAQTRRAMSSKPLGRKTHKAKSVIHLANESKKVKTIVRYAKNSDSSYFIGC